jgi:hypothetical protein
MVGCRTKISKDVVLLFSIDQVPGTLLCLLDNLLSGPAQRFLYFSLPCLLHHQQRRDFHVLLGF